MDNQVEKTELETQEAAQETALSTEVQSQENVESNLPTTNIVMGTRSVKDIANDMLGLKSQPLDVATRTWTPTEIGEKKMMLFLGGGYSWIPSMDNKNVMICLPYVEFLEAYKNPQEEPSLRKWRMSATRIVTMFLQLTGSKEEGFTDIKYKYAPNTGWEIEYIALIPSTQNPQRKIMDFAIRVPQSSN